MHITKVTRGGKLDVYQTIRINLPAASVPKHKRQTIGQIIERRKRAERDARLVQIITR